MTDFLDCVRPANPGEPIDEDIDRAINEALDIAERDIKPANAISAADICHLRTWCIKPTHPPDEPCLEVPRAPMPVSDFGPEQAKRRRY